MYPAATCALRHSNVWELLVATILSAQCTDKRVNEVTPGLFRKYPTIRDFATANQEEMAQEIRSTGFFNNKAKSVIGAARKILADYGGEVPREMDALLSVPGAARKTANVVLGTAGWADQIGRQSVQVAQQDRCLLVHISVELNSALLRKHSSVVLQGMKSIPC